MYVVNSESGSDEVDSPQHQYYTPLPHRPMIKSKCSAASFTCCIVFQTWCLLLSANFAHSPEMLANMKRETESILSGALQQRGLPQVCSCACVHSVVDFVWPPGTGWSQ